MITRTTINTTQMNTSKNSGKNTHTLRSVLFVDHFDSFSNNVVALLRSLGAKVDIVQSAHVQEISLHPYHAIVLSPGPGHPQDYPNSLELIKRIPPEIPLLGVCLGHQMLLHADGGLIVQTCTVPMHGRTFKIESLKTTPRLLAPECFYGKCVLYNSLGCSEVDKPFQTSWQNLASENSFSLIAEHRFLPRIGVQFHPESFVSDQGVPLFHGFLMLPHTHI
jgi:anthranilate synthase/aminodeoxychorismate synthase-like glutamine amidotransferase